MDPDGEFGFVVVGEGEGKRGRKTEGESGYGVSLDFVCATIEYSGGKEAGREGRREEKEVKKSLR